MSEQKDLQEQLLLRAQECRKSVLVITTNGFQMRGVIVGFDRFVIALNGGTVMKRETYQRGLPGVKWGIWNCQRKCFQFSICEDTPMLAEARLHQKIGDDARKWRFEPRHLPGKYATFSPVL